MISLHSNLHFSGLLNRLVNLVAEDNAIEDTIYHLHRALNTGRVDLERFLRVSSHPPSSGSNSVYGKCRISPDNPRARRRTIYEEGPD